MLPPVKFSDLHGLFIRLVEVGLVFLLLIGGCSVGLSSGDQHFEVKAEEKQPRGTFIYGDGDLFEINLPEKTKYKIVESDKTIKYVTREGEHGVIFAECYECILKRINLKTGKVETLFQGRHPTFVNRSQTLFFYRDGLLYRSGPPYDEWEVVGESSQISPVEVDSGDVVYWHENRRFVRYDPESDTSTQLQFELIRPFLPFLWRSPTNELVGYSHQHEKPVSLHLATGRRRVINLTMRGAREGVYVPESDQMIYVGNPWYSLLYIFTHGNPEPMFFYLYDFESAESRYLGRGSMYDGVWLSEDAVRSSVRKSENLW